MSVGQIAVALIWFIVFGGVALVIGRSALGDWRDVRRGRDMGRWWFLWLVWSAIEQWWLAVVAAAVALLVPVALVLNA